MFNKLAGHLSLSEMVSRVIDDSRVKIAADEGKEEKKDDKVKKLVKYEEKEHGHLPSVKEEKEEKGEEKKASIDFSDPDEVEKLASALDTVGDQFAKAAADMQDHGKEYKGGGETLAVMAPVGGKQNYGKDKSKSHNVPLHTPEQKGDAGGPAKTQMENDHAPGKLLKYTKSEYPKSGVLKHASKSVAALQAALGVTAEETPAEETAEVVKFDKKDGEEKQASAVDYILSKVAEGSVEKRMGGETLDSKSGDGPKAPTGGTNSARSMIDSNAAATNAKKVQAKAPQKKLMAEVLTEPMMSKAHDAKVQENLRNAAKGGVKIAAARELLKKIAEEGCTCDGKGECKHCKMKKAMEKKSTGMPATGSSMPTSGPMM